jgi:hypothetical protein
MASESEIRGALEKRKDEFIAQMRCVVSGVGSRRRGPFLPASAHRAPPPARSPRSTITLKDVRRKLEEDMGLERKALDAAKDVVARLLDALLQVRRRVGHAWGPTGAGGRGGGAWEPMRTIAAAGGAFDAPMGGVGGTTPTPHSTCTRAR